MTVVRRDFELGTLFLGDVLDVLGLVRESSVDLVLTDPPYSSGGSTIETRQRCPVEKYQNTGTKKPYPSFSGDHLDQRSYVNWCVEWGSRSRLLLKSGAVHAQFTDWRQLPATVDAVQRAGLHWRGIVPWDKTETARPTVGGFRAQAEYLVWGSNGPLSRSRGVGCLPGAFREPVRRSDKLHVTGKPTALMVRLVAACPPNGVVADWFAGSGTTAVAAVVTGRRFIGCEVSQEYFEIACKRIHEAEARLA
ncbi:DNA methyltransferase [Thalassobaculum sp.]|uniref:DNA-methyltransferase n=1 Tax=Thalassobaculum sp. TaxID=2022740 RepID=UPI0032EB49DB